MRKRRDIPASPKWEKLLIDAVNTPGTLSSAYRRFWNYSVGNQLLALFECMQRGIEPGPIHTFRGWLELGRHVKKGERAISLCMPVSVKRKSKDETIVGDGAERAPEHVTVFVFKPRWFVLAQTEGDPYQPVELPAWSEHHALHT